MAGKIAAYRKMLVEEINVKPIAKVTKSQVLKAKTGAARLYVPALVLSGSPIEMPSMLLLEKSLVMRWKGSWRGIRLLSILGSLSVGLR